MPLSKRWKTSPYSTDRGECVEAALASPPTAWRTSSYTAPDSNHCVEVADAPHLSAVRDTKNRGLGALLFPSPEWRAFVDSAKRDFF